MYKIIFSNALYGSSNIKTISNYGSTKIPRSHSVSKLPEDIRRILFVCPSKLLRSTGILLGYLEDIKI